MNVDITPKVHGTDEVTLHIELEISNVKERIDIGGISQPVVGQRKVIHDIRLREGEVNLLGGLVQDTGDPKRSRAFRDWPASRCCERLFSTREHRRRATASC